VSSEITDVVDGNGDSLSIKFSYCVSAMAGAARQHRGCKKLMRGPYRANLSRNIQLRIISSLVLLDIVTT
jgi:hypothetical protein